MTVSSEHLFSQGMCAEIRFPDMTTEQKKSPNKVFFIPVVYILYQSPKSLEVPNRPDRVYVKKTSKSGGKPFKL